MNSMHSLNKNLKNLFCINISELRFVDYPKIIKNLIEIFNIYFFISKKHP